MACPYSPKKKKTGVKCEIYSENSHTCNCYGDYSYCGKFRKLEDK